MSLTQGTFRRFKVVSCTQLNAICLFAVYSTQQPSELFALFSVFFFLFVFFFFWSSLVCFGLFELDGEFHKRLRLFFHNFPFKNSKSVHSLKPRQQETKLHVSILTLFQDAWRCIFLGGVFPLFWIRLWHHNVLLYELRRETISMRVYLAGDTRHPSVQVTRVQLCTASS